MHLAQHLYLNVSYYMLGKMGMRYNTRGENQTSIIEILDNIEIADNKQENNEDFVKILNKLIEIKFAPN